MSIHEQLLKILVCPETHQALELAEASIIDELNSRIKQHVLKDRKGNLVEEKLEEGLIREDGEVLYPIRKGIPIMLIDSGIVLNAIK